MALQLTEEEVRRLASPELAVRAVTEAHLALATGNAVNVVRSRSRLPKMSLHAMSAASASLGYAGAKVYSATANGMRSVVLLFRVEDGELVATIEANELGRLRTAAASLVAAKLLAPLSSSSLALVGSGFQAEGLLRMYLSSASVFSLNRISIFSRKEERRKRIAELFSRKDLEILSCGSAAEALEGAEIVLTATTSSEPVIDLSMLKSARHVSALGSNSLARRELPPRVVTGATLVVVDARDVAANEAGDLLWPLENGKLNWHQIVELGELLTGSKTADVSSSGFTLFCSQGLAVQDLYLATEIFKQYSAA